VLLIFARCQQRTSLCQSAVTSSCQHKWCVTSASILMLSWQWNIMSTVLRATVSFSSTYFIRSHVSLVLTSQKGYCQLSFSVDLTIVMLLYLVCHKRRCDLFNVRWMQPLVSLPIWDPVTTSTSNEETVLASNQPAHHIQAVSNDAFHSHAAVSWLHAWPRADDSYHCHDNWTLFGKWPLVLEANDPIEVRWTCFQLFRTCCMELNTYPPADNF